MKQGETIDLSKIGIPPPPDEIYKYRRNRMAPAQDIWGRGTVTYIPERAEYKDGIGNFVHFMGTPFPSRCVAPPEAIHAMNGIKRLLLVSVQLLSSKELRIPLFTSIFIGKKGMGRLLNQVCGYFLSIGAVTILPYYMLDGYYCPLVKELRKALFSFLLDMGVEREIADQTAETLAMFFEYDNAYRYRIQDLIYEANVSDLIYNLPKELERLIKIGATREMVPGGGEQVTGRFQSALKAVKMAWRIPFVRNSIRKSIQSMDFEVCKADEGELYHTLLYGDYNVRGKTIEERVKIYRSYHGDNMEDWPPRIMIKSNAMPPNLEADANATPEKVS